MQCFMLDTMVMLKMPKYGLKRSCFTFVVSFMFFDVDVLFESSTGLYFHYVNPEPGVTGPVLCGHDNRI